MSKKTLGAQESIRPATAQTITDQSHRNVQNSITFKSGQPFQTTEDIPPRGYFVRLLGGLHSIADSTGFGVGDGIGVRPFDNQAGEVAGTFDFARIEGVNVYEGAVNYLYNFQLSEENVTPIAGAGIVIARATLGQLSDTEAAFQLVGGIDIPTSSTRVFRGELRFQFFSGDTAVVLLGGISF